MVTMIGCKYYTTLWTSHVFLHLYGMEISHHSFSLSTVIYSRAYGCGPVRQDCPFLSFYYIGVVKLRNFLLSVSHDILVDCGDNGLIVKNLFLAVEDYVVHVAVRIYHSMSIKMQNHENHMSPRPVFTHSQKTIRR
jgi:hypothetical protein